MAKFSAHFFVMVCFLLNLGKFFQVDSNDYCLDFSYGSLTVKPCTKR